MEINDSVELKLEYNKTLKRYYNGCTYLEAHPNEIDKYMPIIDELQNKLGDMIYEIQFKEKRTLTPEEILSGFGDDNK